MKILITGGAGFIGSHLAEKLSVKNDVIILDNFITGRKENLAKLNVELISHDIVKPFDIKCDVIFNMASPASPVGYQEHPLETMEVNAFGMKNILENAKKHGARVLQSSTSEIYGDPLVSPQVESYWGNVNTLGPRSCYDESKRFAETLCYNYYHKFGVNVILARIFNTYGPRMDKKDGRVIPNFVTQALSGKDITLYGNGLQTRSFCYVSDLVDGLTKLAFSDITFDVFNVGNPHEITLQTLANKVKELAQSKSNIIHKPLPQDDPKQRCPNITKIKKAVNWEPKVSLDDGLKKTIEWFKSH
ncbi:MAG: UDP-glucuronic acid decarboxylase family protein [Candidatus Micrarchaeota archaeon]